MNLETGAYREIEIEFDHEELEEHEPGFMETSKNLQYSLGENAFNSLENVLDGQITGKPFDRERQLRAFSEINASQDGNCGEKVFNLVIRKIRNC